MSLYSKWGCLHILWQNRGACSRAKPDIFFYLGWCTWLEIWPVYWAVVLILLPQFIGVCASFCELVFVCLFVWYQRNVPFWKLGRFVDTYRLMEASVSFLNYSQYGYKYYLHYLYNIYWICDQNLSCHPFICPFTLPFFSTLNWLCCHCNMM